MRLAAYILFSLVCFLVVEPLFSGKKTAMTKCGASLCCKKHASKKSSKEQDKDCNPFMGCSSCNLFIIDKPVPDQLPVILLKEKNIVKNDNRIIQNLSECWHPPNTIV
jgi:hypothetical protein